VSSGIVEFDRATLMERAAQLSRRVAVEHVGTRLSLVRFRAGDDVFALESRFVREVVRLRQLSPVPGAPAAVLGVTTYQGEILAVVDLLSVVHIAGVRLRDSLWLLVLGLEAAEFAITADEILGAVDVSHDAVLPPDAAGAAKSPLIAGVTDDATAVLDGAALLTSDMTFGSGGDAARPGRDIQREKEGDA
jgi:purine-binding chemotaxis protein CheW